MKLEGWGGETLCKEFGLFCDFETCMEQPVGLFSADSFNWSSIVVCVCQVPWDLEVMFLPWCVDVCL